MPERPAARPKAPAPPLAESSRAGALDELAAGVVPAPEFSGGTGAASPALPEAATAMPVPAAVAVSEEHDLAMAEFDGAFFSESNIVAIDVERGGDPLQEDIEQVAVLYANGQDAASRALLEIYIRSYPGSAGLRFWWMYFDLLQQLGERAAFDQLGLEFAEACEMSPPTWREQGKRVAPSTPGGRVNLTLQGVLTAESARLLLPLTAALEKKQAVHLDCTRLIGCDDDIAGRLAQALALARQRQGALGLAGAEVLLARLQGRLVVGQAAHLPAWTLMLELLQRCGTQDVFEEKAVDYAITFELSPPSWEVAETAAVPAAPLPAKADDAHVLSGDLRNCRFDELGERFARCASPVLDFSAVRRLDFFSAGQLVNRLAALKAAGREVVIRGPNHLVAELMAVVGLNQFARIIIPKS